MGGYGLMDDRMYMLTMCALLTIALVTVTLNAVYERSMPASSPSPPIVTFPDGHDYYRVDTRGAYSIPIHCIECRKCRKD